MLHSLCDCFSPRLWSLPGKCCKLHNGHSVGDRINSAYMYSTCSLLQRAHRTRISDWIITLLCDFAWWYLGYLGSSAFVVSLCAGNTQEQVFVALCHMTMKVLDLVPCWLISTMLVWQLPFNKGFFSFSWDNDVEVLVTLVTVWEFVMWMKYPRLFLLEIFKTVIGLWTWAYGTWFGSKTPIALQIPEKPTIWK